MRDASLRKVLIVDDNEYFRRMQSMLLEEVGFEVLVAADGREAAGLLQDPGRVVHAVITDIAMPNLDGLNLCRLLHEMRPGTPVLIVSGSEGSAEFKSLDYAGPIRLLRKPFGARDFYKAFAAILSSADAE